MRCVSRGPRTHNGFVRAHAHRPCMAIRALVLQEPHTSVLLGPRTTYLHHWLINNILHSSVCGSPWARGPNKANRSNRLIAGPANQSGFTLSTGMINKSGVGIGPRQALQKVCTYCNINNAEGVYLL